MRSNNCFEHNNYKNNNKKCATIETNIVPLWVALLVEQLSRFYLPSRAVNLEESDQSRQLYLAYLSHRRVVYYLTFYRQINSFVITLNLSIIPTADWLINDIQYYVEHELQSIMSFFAICESRCKTSINPERSFTLVIKSLEFQDLLRWFPNMVHYFLR